MKVEFTLSIGFLTARQKEVVEVEDDATDDDIEEYYQFWLGNFIDGGWHKVDG